MVHKGDGSIYRRDGGWEAALFIGGRRRTARARTARDARERLVALRRKAEEGRADIEVDERLTVAEFLESWLDVAKTTVRPNTHKRYREYVRVHAVPEIGYLRLIDLRPLHLQQLYARRLQSGASPSTVQHLHATLHRALKMAERWEQVTRNVADLVSPPRVPKHRIEPLTVAEVQRLFATAAGTRFEAAFVIAVVTGLRLGELLGLHWADVDLGDQPALRVRGSLQRAEGRLQIMETKTAGSVRSVALGRLGADALTAHRLRQLEERISLGESWTDQDLVFPNRWGDYMNPEWFRRGVFQPLLKRAGLRPIRFHDLRHTFATLQLANNQPVKIVSEMLGHSRTAITQDIYTHVSAQMQRAAADALDDALRSANDEPPTGDAAG